ncbi:MAG: helix-hairpin-helix domain-containing protein [Verrucomicrobiota bacterium]
MRRAGSILVGVLWCMVLLSVLVIGVLHTARMDLLVVKNYGDRVQAHYLALAGVERAKALIFNDVVTRQQTAKNHTGSLYNDPKDFRDVSLGRGKFRVFRRASPEDGAGIIYGISDEESRLNLNSASAGQLTNLDGMTPDILAAIIAWRTPATQNPAAQNSAAPGAANSDYYLSLRPPYLARNGPFQTVRELLMVRGVTPELLLGNDVNQNGFLDANDDLAGPAAPAAKPPPPPSPGWAALLTVTDTDKNVNASGKDRVNPQTADEATLMTVPGITQPIARAIISYRGQNQLQTLDDLLSVTAQNSNQGAGQNPGAGANPAGGRNASGNSGPPVISQELFGQIADDLTLAGETDLPGLINLNTASLDVLLCLPGVQRPLAQAILNYRASTGYFDNVAGLLKVDGMTRAIFKQVVPLVTARSETYRIVCEGKINSSGALQRIEAIVHIGRSDIETLAYREDL